MVLPVSWQPIYLHKLFGNICKLYSFNIARPVLSCGGHQIHSNFSTNNYYGSEHQVQCSIFQPHSLIVPKNVLMFQSRFAGHAKWQNIKQTKESKDQARGRLFSKLSLRIKMAIKSGGSTNPSANQQLANVLDEAHKCNMPKGTIKNVMENSQKGMENAKECFLEYRGPDGICLYVSVFTDNLNRAKGYTNAITKKFGFREERSTGSVRYLFKERGLILVPALKENTAITLEDAEEHAIEAGAEEVELNDGILQFVCAPRDLQSVRESLVQYGYTISETDVGFTPVTPVAVAEDKLEVLSSMIPKIEELEEVVRVYPNVE